MAVRKLKPTTPGQRHRIKLSYDTITTSTPEKSLIKKYKKTGGRNDRGKMTIQHVGGGHKRRYRLMDFKREKFGVAPTGLQVGAEVVSGKGAPIEVGNAMPLSEIPLGTIIHNLELRPSQGALMVRSAGAFAQLMARDGKYATIKLTSGEIRQILVTCLATIGSVSNAEAQLARKGKAGRNRWLGRRPRTRPVVMNPVDHPMGGCEGKASGGHPRSKKGIPAKGYKTRSKKKTSNKYIIERRKKK